MDERLSGRLEKAILLTYGREPTETLLISVISYMSIRIRRMVLIQRKRGQCCVKEFLLQVNFCI